MNTTIPDTVKMFLPGMQKCFSYVHQHNAAHKRLQWSATELQSDLMRLLCN